MPFRIKIGTKPASESESIGSKVNWNQNRLWNRSVQKLIGIEIGTGIEIHGYKFIANGTDIGTDRFKSKLESEPASESVGTN